MPLSDNIVSLFVKSSNFGLEEQETLIQKIKNKIANFAEVFYWE